VTEAYLPVPEPDPDEPLEAAPVDEADGGDPYPTDEPVEQDSEYEMTLLELPELPAEPEVADEPELGGLT
jgi:hypothetical protein